MRRSATSPASLEACAWAVPVTLAVLAGCASAPRPSVPAESPAPVAAEDRSGEQAAAAALAALTNEQRELAASAERQGRWADAAWAWDVVLALHPDDAAAEANRRRARESARTAIDALLARAQQARRRGDLDAAARALLEALVVAPDDAGAANALREVEAQRRSKVSAALARLAPVRRPPQAPQSIDERNGLEHAALLAAYGDIGAAIAALQPWAAPGRGSAQTRDRLADLYLRQADQLRSSDAAAAIAALERCLQLRPADQRALSRLRELRAAKR